MDVNIIQELKRQLTSIHELLNSAELNQLNELDLALTKQQFVQAYELLLKLKSEVQEKSQEKLSIPEFIDSPLPIKGEEKAQFSYKEINPEQDINSTATQQTSLFDILSNKAPAENSMVEKMKKKSITNLKQAIGINEKYIFLNELFEGNLNEYNKSIQVINEMNNRTEAFVFIESEIKPRFDWSKSPKAEAMFMEMVERRFA